MGLESDESTLPTYGWQGLNIQTKVYFSTVQSQTNASKNLKTMNTEALGVNGGYAQKQTVKWQLLRRMELYIDTRWESTTMFKSQPCRKNELSTFMRYIPGKTLQSSIDIMILHHFFDTDIDIY